MDITEKQNLLVAFLIGEGYRPDKVGDDIVTVKVAGKVIVLICSEDDPTYYRIIFPFAHFDDVPEDHKVVAFGVTSQIKAGAIQRFNRTMLAACVEGHYATLADVQAVLPRLIDTVMTTAGEFADQVDAHEKAKATAQADQGLRLVDLDDISAN